jgi:hypothetical protein
VSLYFSDTDDIVICRYKHLRMLVVSTDDICKDHPDPSTQPVLWQLWAWLSEFKDSFLIDTDKQLLLRFISDQNRHDVQLSQMQMAVSTYIGIVQRLYDNARDGLITATNSNEHAAAIGEAIDMLVQIYVEHVRISV